MRIATLGTLRPLIVGDVLPEGAAVCVYVDGDGGGWLLVNRSALCADPEGTVAEIAAHCESAFING